MCYDIYIVISEHFIIIFHQAYRFRIAFRRHFSFLVTSLFRLCMCDVQRRLTIKSNVQKSTFKRTKIRTFRLLLLLLSHK